MYPVTSDLTEYIRTLIMQNENFYVKAKASGKDISDEIISAADQELDMLTEIASLDPEIFTSAMDYDGFLPVWTLSLIHI